jgi:hypothetical protein
MHHLHESLDVHQNMVLAKSPYHYIAVIDKLVAISLPNSSNIGKMGCDLGGKVAN